MCKISIREHSTIKVVAVVAVLALVASACGSSEPAAVDTTNEGDAAAAVSSEETDTADGSADPQSGSELEITPVSLPDGLRPWWESSDRSASLGGGAFMLAASSDVEIGGAEPNVVILRLDQALEWTRAKVSIPASATSADMFLTGTQLAVSYLDAQGEIVVLTSTDGTDFAETRLPIPEQYVAADVWDATSLIGRVVGAADLNGEVFAIVDIGIRWPRPADIVQEYAAGQAESPEVAEAIRSVGTIRSETKGDDTLYEFVKDGEVVGEALASDAGIEAGYLDAYDSYTGSTFESQSWMIDGTSSRNLGTSPFSGQTGIRLHALYPIEGGVGALVTDFNAEEPQAAGFGSPGILAAGSGLALAGESKWDLRTMVTLDGILWVAEALLGVANPNFGSLAWAMYGGVPLFILMFYAEEAVGVATSDDGIDWGIPDYTLDLELPGGGSVQVWVTGEGTFHVFIHDDGSFRKYKVEGEGEDKFITKVFDSTPVSTESIRVMFARGRAQQAADERASQAEQEADLSGGFADFLFPPRPTED